jgi:hypothetical protein
MTESENGGQRGIDAMDTIRKSNRGVNNMMFYTKPFAFEPIALRIPRRHYFDPPRWGYVLTLPKTPPGTGSTHAQHENTAPRYECKDSRTLDLTNEAQRHFRDAFLIPLKEPSAASDSRIYLRLGKALAFAV